MARRRRSKLRQGLGAALLRLIGIRQEKPPYRYARHDNRLTGVHGNVVKEILA